MSKKTALITGAGRGIGFGITEKLASEGFNIVICDIWPEADIAPQLAELEAKYEVQGLYCKCDVSDSKGREAMLAEIIAEFGVLNVLVNNAGVAPEVRADILDMTGESYDRVMTINLKGPYFLTQLAARHMIEMKSNNPDFEGCIINIGSISADTASVSRGEYCLSKAGVTMATKLWAARLGEYDIPVYEIRPGVIKTDMTATVTEKYDKLIAEGLTIQPRWGYPEDIAKAAAMLARGDLAYSTGQIINIDGGMQVSRL
ncbi:MAG: 3-ketoacyl-ACP reductase [Victivallaceae bacterium]|nr:3-ketoacyl-ACP reductase [Victivallaceae bacterium]